MADAPRKEFLFTLQKLNNTNNQQDLKAIDTAIKSIITNKPDTKLEYIVILGGVQPNNSDKYSVKVQLDFHK